MPDVNWMAVAAAIGVGLVIAWVWYSDWGLVGATWRRLTGITPQDSARAGARPFVVLVASVMATALVLAVACSVVTAAGMAGLPSALTVGLLAWFGFSLSTLAQHNGFEQKPARLTAINSAYQLVLFLGMATPIGLLQG